MGAATYDDIQEGLKRLFERYRDDRFHQAIEAMKEHMPDGRGPGNPGLPETEKARREGVVKHVGVLVMEGKSAEQAIKEAADKFRMSYSVVKAAYLEMLKREEIATSDLKGILT